MLTGHAPAPATVTVFTAAVGPATDTLRAPELVAPGVRYICGSDRQPPPPWEWVHVDPNPNAVIAARRFKILLHRHVATDFYLWHDAAYRLTVDPRIFAPVLLRYDLAVFPHPWLATIRAEADELIRRDLVDSEILYAQIDAYRAEGFPVDESTHVPGIPPHASTGFLLRRNDKRTTRFNDRWWAEMYRYGHPRDQMSFDYTAWKNGMRIGMLEGVYTGNPYAVWDDGTRGTRQTRDTTDTPRRQEATA